uniref:Uncharacterized protein n=1 Tax=Amphimedon queenslandica TaxID=400682 RepID=A0A1X7T1J0_AMPQE
MKQASLAPGEFQISSINTTISNIDAAGLWWCSGEVGVDCTDVVSGSNPVR